MRWADAFDDEVQPLTLDGWLRRQRRDLALLRAATHARLDELFDKHAREIEQDVARIEVDLQR